MGQAAPSGTRTPLCHGRTIPPMTGRPDFLLRRRGPGFPCARAVGDARSPRSFRRIPGARLVFRVSWVGRCGARRTSWAVTTSPSSSRRASQRNLQNNFCRLMGRPSLRSPRVAVVSANPITEHCLRRMARGGIEPPTRGFSVPNRPYTLDQHGPYRATIPEVRVVAHCL